MSFRKLVVIVMLLVITMTTLAQNFNVTRTSILVDDTDAKDPIKLKQAFAQILANNTGEDITSILQNSVFAETDLTSGIKRSYFEKIESQFLTSQSKHHYWFYLVMYESFIQKTIRQAGFSILPHKREKIMLWLVAQEDGEEKLPLGYAYNNRQIVYWIEHWVTALGLNIVMPNIDESDKSAVTPRSINSLSFEADNQSINRYGIEQSLLISIKKSTDAIKIRSGFKTPGNEMSIQHFQEATADMGVALYPALADIAQRYGYKYKVNNNALQKHTVQIVIKAINSYDQINAITKYFSKLSVVDSFKIVSASVGQFIMTVDLSISTQAFLQIIARDKIIQHQANASINQLVFSPSDAQH